MAGRRDGHLHSMHTVRMKRHLHAARSSRTVRNAHRADSARTLGISIDQDEFVFWRYRKSPEGEVAVGPRLDLGQAREPLGSDADETSGATQSAACLSITGSESCRVPIAQPWSRQSARLRAGD